MIRFILSIIAFACANSFSQDRLNVDQEIAQYMQRKMSNETESISTGSVSNGGLINGVLVPYKSKNFIYFDRDSYLEGRAFLNSMVRTVVLNSYDSLYKLMPHRYFCIMECSNEKGGDFFPHRTHQNGKSVDFMMPKKRNGKPYYGLDTLGAAHYYLRFSDEGRYARNPEIEIDFNLIAQHILILNYYANKLGSGIEKVIIKIELKDELFATYYGRLLKETDIYFAKALSPLINSLHDEHYHIDFK